MSRTLEAKKEMRCGEVRRSTRPGKKVMKKVCQNGAERLIHAGDSKYGHNISPGARKNFRARHNCATASPNTPRGLACEALWEEGSPRKTTAQKGRAAK